MPPSTCPNCCQHPLETFYTVPHVPVHSVLLVDTREEALGFPSGSITLGLCRGCGFISNSSFDEAKMRYSPRCEETQGFSPTFQAFHRRLAQDLIERCGLRGKTVLEIGCGKGEFISLLCELGGNRGIGFDPAFVPERRPEAGGDQVEFVQDFYGEKYADIAADFIACKMTLEHIPDTLAFVRTVRRAIGANRNTQVFFQIPDMTRVLEDVAFWDVYHEHCSYFTAGALRNLFTLAGFAIEEVWTDYDGQYLMLTAKPAEAGEAPQLTPPAASELAAVRAFAREAEQRIAGWRDTVARLGRTVIWGSGSKGVAFLSALDARAGTDSIDYAVDINPYREGFFMPGTGQEIVAPGFLATHPPDAVIAMNSIYSAEIAAELARQGVRAALLPIEAVAAPA